jgi:AraC-like DNA-binding protein
MLHYGMLIKLCLARELLTQNMECKISVKHLAQELGMSQYHFIRLFAAVFGVTPHRYRLINQLQKAKRELLMSKKPITDVAFDCGFSSLGTFSSVFKNDLGMTPRQYRHQYFTSHVQHHNCFELMLGV